MSLEERKNELWKSFEEMPAVMGIMARDYAPYHWELEQDYQPRQLVWRERGFTGFEGEPVFREIFV